MYNMSTNFDSIILNGQSLRPAPFVSTNYEYVMSGRYIIGGFLLVNLSGTIVGTDVANQINNISSLQANTNCVDITIGCSGGSDFLSGSGRIRSINITPSDQPYTASYSMQIAVQTLDDGNPAVQADTEFLDRTCLNNVASKVCYLQSYNETLSINGEANIIGSVDNTLQVSKSYIKASGKISIVSYMRSVCGVQGYDGLTNSLDVLNERVNSLMDMDICVDDSPLSDFAGWNRWLDTKSLSINYNGGIEWSFDMYLSKGNCKPIAWIDITTEDKKDQRKQLTTKNINGTIKGLSSATIHDYLGDKVNATERISNAESAFSALETIIKNGSWPSEDVTLSDPNCNTNNSQCQVQVPMCLQRTSSTIKKSPVTGEISFNAEFSPISACLVNNIELTVDDFQPVARHAEYIIPGAGDAVVIDLNATTPHKISITARGSITNCDKTKLSDLITCIDNIFNQQLSSIQSGGIWIMTKNTKSIGTYSYTLSKEFVECDA